MRKRLANNVSMLTQQQLMLINEVVTEAMALRAANEEANPLTEPEIEDISIVVSVSKSSRPAMKTKGYFWLVGDDVIHIARIAKVEKLRTSGAVIKAFEDLPIHLQEKASQALSKKP